MKYKICLSMFAVAMLIAAVTLNSYKITPTDTKSVAVNKVAETTTVTTTKTVSNQNKKDNEIMKGLWVTYMELDMSDTDRSYSAFKNKFDTIVSDAIKCGFNTLIVQVRPFSDALYYSKYYPHSHILSGTQGKDPEYDALNYMCQKCHENGLQIHAWVNPFRISTNNTPSKLSDDNPYEKDESIGVKTDTGIYINPAIKKARELIVKGVKEIVENYDVDGIQFDDYFYPTKDKSFDSEEYNSYLKAQNGDAMKLSRWRKDNVNKLIKETYKAVHSSKDNVMFGISPQGNIKNNNEIYADVKTWCSQQGYIDYICPQLYYSLDNPALAYEDAIDSWKKIKKNNDLVMYSGLAGYKAGTDNDEGTWEDFDDILQKEYKIAINKKYNGIMLYSYNSLKESCAKKEIKNLVKELN